MKVIRMYNINSNAMQRKGGHASHPHNAPPLITRDSTLINLMTFADNLMVSCSVDSQNGKTIEEALGLIGIVSGQEII